LRDGGRMHTSMRLPERTRRNRTSEFVVKSSPLLLSSLLRVSPLRRYRDHLRPY